MVDPGPEPSVDLAAVVADVARTATLWRADAATRAVEDQARLAVRGTIPGAGGSAEALLELAEQRATFAAPTPPGSTRAAVVLAKRAVHRATVGPLRHLADQVGALGGSLVAAVRAVDRRLDQVEQVVGTELPVPPLPGLEPAAVAACLAALAGAPQPILHAEAAGGELVAALAADGVAAAGVDPVPDRVLAARASGADVRLAEARPHLLALTHGAIGSVVLSGWTDLTPAGAVAPVLARLATLLAPGGRVVVVVADRETFAARHPLAADLAVRPPLLPGTWAHLLAATGLTVGDMVDLGGGAGHVVVAGLAPA